MRIVNRLQLDTTSDYIHLVPFSDVDVDKPDEKSIMTYVAQFLKHHPGLKQSDSEGQPEEEVTHILDTPFIVFSLHPTWFVFLFKCHSYYVKL